MKELHLKMNPMRLIVMNRTLETKYCMLQVILPISGHLVGSNLCAGHGPSFHPHYSDIIYISRS